MLQKPIRFQSWSRGSSSRLTSSVTSRKLSLMAKPTQTTLNSQILALMSHKMWDWSWKLKNLSPSKATSQIWTYKILLLRMVKLSSRFWIIMVKKSWSNMVGKKMSILCSICSVMSRHLVLLTSSCRINLSSWTVRVKLVDWRLETQIRLWSSRIKSTNIWGTMYCMQRSVQHQKRSKYWFNRSRINATSSSWIGQITSLTLPWVSITRIIW